MIITPLLNIDIIIIWSGYVGSTKSFLLCLATLCYQIVVYMLSIQSMLCPPILIMGEVE